MKSLFLILVTFVCTVAAANTLTAGEISARVQKQGGRAVLWSLWENDAELTQVLSGIESGDNSWLNVALLLRPFSDAGASEDLDYSVARALPKAPERVLSLVGHGFELRFICTSPFNEPAPGVAEAYEQAALAALAKVRAPKLQPLAAQCSKLVKLPQPGA